MGTDPAAVAEQAARLARVDDRRVLNGIFWVLRTDRLGAICRSATARPTTVYNRFNRWAKAGVWVRVFEALAEKAPDSMLLIDSSIIRAHQQAATLKGGGSRPRSFSWRIEHRDQRHGRRTRPARRRHPVGRPGLGQAAVAELLAAHPAPGDVIADRGYDARAVLDLIAARGGRGHIPTQRDRKCQRTVAPCL